MAADLLEAVTHRLRTDISALQVIAEGVLAVPFEDDERAQVRAEVGEVGADAQRRLSAVREVMVSLHPGAAREPEPLVTLLEAELEGAGVATAVKVLGDERPATLVPGSGWSACARLLAAAVASDKRLAGAPIAVRAHPDGWEVEVGGGRRRRAAGVDRAVPRRARARRDDRRGGGRIGFRERARRPPAGRT